MTTSGMQRNRELKRLNVRLLDLTIPMKISQCMKMWYIIFIMARQCNLKTNPIHTTNDQLGRKLETKPNETGSVELSRFFDIGEA